MRDALLNLVIGWATLLSLIMVIAAARVTLKEIRQSEKKLMAVIDNVVLWGLLGVVTYFTGRLIHGWWT